MDTKLEKVRIFISHKEEDHEIARAIKRILLGRTGRLEVYIFEEVPAATDWEDWIQETLAKSDVLLLLYTTPSYEWDWCLYETGLFAADVNKKVVCLCNAQDHKNIPKPLRSIQAVKAERRELVEKFLHPLLRTREYTGISEPLSSVSDEDLNRDAEKIAGLIAPKQIKSRFTCEHFVMKIPDIDVLKQGVIPDNTRIEGPSEGSRIFDLDDSTLTWGDITRRAKPGIGTFWVEELTACIIAAAKKHRVPVQTATLRDLTGGDIFRPVLYRVDRKNRVPYNFYVLFTKELVPEDVIGGPGAFGTLFSMLKFANRFRWEVIRPFIERIEADSPDSPKDKEVLCTQIRDSIRAIDTEARRLKHIDEHSVVEAFEPDNAKEIGKMFDRWRTIYRDLVNSMKENDIDKVYQVLKETRTMNGRFLQLAAKRYSELIEQVDVVT